MREDTVVSFRVLPPPPFPYAKPWLIIQISQGIDKPALIKRCDFPTDQQHHDVSARVAETNDETCARIARDRAHASPLYRSSVKVASCPRNQELPKQNK